MTVPNVSVVNLPGCSSSDMHSDRFKSMTSQNLKEAFIEAAKTGHLETIQSIMSLDTFRIDPDTLAKAFIEAAENAHIETVRAIKNFSQKSNSLYVPPDLNKDFIELVETLLDAPNSAKISYKCLKKSFLRVAGCGYTEIISLLMSSNKFLWISKKDFCRTLLRAVKGNHLEVAKVLVNSEMFQELNIDSALHILRWAASRGNINVVKAILETYEINAKHRVKAYRWAISNCHTESAKAIIDFDILKRMDSKSLEQMLIGALFNDDEEIKNDIISIIDSDDSKNINAWSLYQDLRSDLFYWKSKINSAQIGLLEIIISSNFLVRIESNNLNGILQWALQNNSKITRAVLESDKLQCIDFFNLCNSFIWALKEDRIDLTKAIINQLGAPLKDCPTISDFSQVIVGRFQDDDRDLGEIFLWAIDKRLSLVVNAIMSSNNFKNIGSEHLYVALMRTSEGDYDIEIVKSIMMLAKSKIDPHQLSVVIKNAIERKNIQFIKIIDSDSFKQVESNILFEAFMDNREEVHKIILCKLLDIDPLSNDLRLSSNPKIVDLVQAIVNRSQTNKSRDLREILKVISQPCYLGAFEQIMRKFDAFENMITSEELNEVFEKVLHLVENKRFFFSCSIETGKKAAIQRSVKNNSIEFAGDRKSIALGIKADLEEINQEYDEEEKIYRVRMSNCADIVRTSIERYQCINSSNLTKALRWASRLPNEDLIRFIESQANFIRPEALEAGEHRKVPGLEILKQSNGNPKKKVNKELRDALKCDWVKIKSIIESENFQDIHSINICRSFIWALRDDNINMAQDIINRFQCVSFKDKDIPKMDIPTISDLAQALVNRSWNDDFNELGQTLIWASSINQKEIVKIITNSGSFKKIQSSDIDKALSRASKKRNRKEVIEMLSGNESSERLMWHKV